MPRMEPVPVLSVIIPVHNSEATLQRCVESVLTQTAPFNIEILLVENGSTDNSLSICRQLAAENPEIRLIVSPKIGVSEARNIGIAEAKAGSVTFVDADDYVEPDMYQRMMEVKEQYGVGIVSCNFINEFPDGSTRRQFPDTGEIILKNEAEAAYDVLMDSSSSAPWIRIFDKKFLSTRKFPEKVRFEDHAVMFEWVGNGGQAVHIDAPLYHYCHHPASYTSDAERNPEKIRDYFSAELKRIRFIRKYPYFSRRQRVTTLRKTVGQAVLALKRLAGLFYGNQEESGLLKFRDELLDELSQFSPLSIGLSNYLQYMRIKNCWPSFIRKQRQKMRSINN